MAKARTSRLTHYGGSMAMLILALGVGGFGAYKIYKNEKAKKDAAKLTTGA